MEMEASLKSIIRDIPDYPKEGILFKDITPLLNDGPSLKHACDQMVDFLKDKNLKAIIGIESRGFIFSPVIAYQLGIGFIPVRKQGKLPAETESVAYSLEYGEAVLEIHKDALQPGDRVAIVDDLLATGGTAEAAAKLAEKLGATVEGMAFLIELGFLDGGKKLSKYDTLSLITY